MTLSLENNKKENKEFLFREAISTNDAVTAHKLLTELNLPQLTDIGEALRKVLEIKNNFGLARSLLKNIVTVISFEPQNKQQYFINHCCAVALKFMLDRLDHDKLSNINTHVRKAIMRLYEKLKSFSNESTTTYQKSFPESRPSCIQKLMSTLNCNENASFCDPFSQQARCYLPSHTLRSVGVDPQSAGIHTVVTHLGTIPRKR
jgi:hypothetical protein